MSIGLKVRAIPVTALLLSTLAACGGGGGDSTSATAGIDVAAAWNNYLTTPIAIVTTGVGPSSAGSVRYTLGLRSTPGPISSFALSGLLTSTVAQTLTLDTGDGAPAGSDRTFYFQNGQLVGINNSDGSCSIAAASTNPLPRSAAVGTSGALATTLDYATCTPPIPATAVAATVFNYSVEADSGMTLFCVDERQTVAGQFAARATICLEASPDGTLGSHARITLYLSDSVLSTSRNY